MLELILLQLGGLEILFQPVINTQWLGCPDDCIVQGSQRHETINFFLSPLFFFIVGIGITSGIVFKIRNLIVRRKPKEQITIDDNASQIVESPKKMLDFSSRVDKDKQEKRAFLALEKLQKTTVDPQQAFNQWVKSLDPTHPQTDNIKSVHTETKEANIVPPEQKLLKEVKEFPTSEEIVPDLKLEKDVDRVHELMEKEKLTEDEAVTKIIEESTEQESSEEIEEFIDEDKDIFSQDKPPKKKLPVPLAKLISKFKKKEKEKTVSVLTELGIKRRDEYAKIINAQMLNWVFPLERYRKTVTDNKGKDSTVIVNEIADEKIHEEIKKFALFCSMAEFIVDQKRKKKIYWRQIPIAK